MKKKIEKENLENNNNFIVGVVFPIPLDKIFDYIVPSKFAEQIEIGKRVRVEFGKRKLTGIIYKIYNETEYFNFEQHSCPSVFSSCNSERNEESKNINLEKLKPILKVVDKQNFFSKEMLVVAEKIKSYYLCSIGESLWAFLPKNASTKKIEIENFFESDDASNYYSKEFLIPNIFQQKAINAINESILKNAEVEKENELSISFRQGDKITTAGMTEKVETSNFLLFGVAGSGKTEVFLNSIKTALEIGKDVIYLVPEISLTPQTLIRLKARFGDKVGVLHSQMLESQRFLVLSKILSGEIKILLGARSAIFAPFRNLGLIIIDEEQEDSYKQEQKPSYDARRIATWRAKLNNATLVFGSATPSIETFFMSQNENDDCKVLELPYKASEISENDSEIKINRNEIAIIDMKVELLKKNFSVISEYLRKEIEKRLDKKEQILLFLNRRGDSTFVFCRKCGFVMKCPHCNVSLVYHSDNEKLQCHYCGYSVDNVSECPSCKSKYIKYFGNAIQKVEKEIKKIFPYAKVARLDKDISSQDRGYNFDIYKLFKNKKIDILIGTQMIAKGFDFENLSLVGVISADTALNLADFRASEKTFNLLVQVIGRAGRKNKGLGIIQTYYPENYAILNAKNLNYLDFYKQEIQWRKELNYPPFSKIILITFRGKNNELVEKEISNLYDILISDTLLKDNDELDILGVYQPTIIKKYDNFRWQILIKIKILKKDEDSQLNNYCQKVYELVKLSKNLNTLESKNIKVSVTVDPTQML